MASSPNHLDPNAAPADVASIYTPAFLEKRRQAIEKIESAAGFRGIDDLAPKLPAGHAYAVRKSSRLTSDFRRVHRKGAMDITPQDVVDALEAGGVKNWVLMGLHGYVGYMPDPRATQDVDVMVPYSERGRAKKAIADRWPMLQIHELSQVTRFMDPADLDADGKPKPVVDVMHPWASFQEVILKEFVVVDPDTKHRIPTLEAAICLLFCSMHCKDRDFTGREMDACDLRRIVRANRNTIDANELRRASNSIGDGAEFAILETIETACSDRAFVI